MQRTLKRKKAPPLAYGRLSTFFNHLKISIQGTGKGFYDTARFNKPFMAYYIDGGTTGLQLNSGAGDYALLPLKNRWTIYYYGSVQSQGKTWAEYTPEDAKALANHNWEVIGGANIVTSNLSEKTGEMPRDAYVIEYAANPPAYLAYEQETNRLASEAGGYNYGGYGGTLNPHVERDVNAYRQGLLSDAGAFAFCQANQNAEHPFWTTQGWTYSQCLMKHYFGSTMDLTVRINKMAGANELLRAALRHVGSPGTRLGTIHFQNKMEFLDRKRQGYTELQKRSLGDGITFFDHVFPGYSPAYQILEILLCLIMCDDVIIWEDSTLVGEDPGVVEPNFFQDRPAPEPKFPYTYQKNAAGEIGTYKSTATKAVLPDANRVFPYPGGFEGMKDLGKVGAWFFGKMCSYVGGVAPWKWASHRLPNGTWCSSGRDYLADRLVDRLPLVVTGEIGNKGWALVIDFTATQAYQREIDLGNGDTGMAMVKPDSINLYFY
jgi:hypothetical protein